VPTYYNHRNDAVYLAGHNGEVVLLKPGASRELDSYYDKYVVMGMISRRDRPSPNVQLTRNQMVQKAMRVVSEQASPRVVQRNVSTRVVGRQTGEDAARILQKNLVEGGYPISNGIGVGVLSYNRATSLRRLIESVRRHTDLRRTTVFVSDDASTDPATIAYLEELSRDQHIVVLRNRRRLGVAGNSNRLLRCLARFGGFLLLNDDVEVLARGWDALYHDAARNCGMHHFVYNQPGVYGAQPGRIWHHGGVSLSTVDDKPHGAVLYGTSRMLEVAGYFDESYGTYGFEHVDWSSKAYEFGLQLPGYHDLPTASQYFRTHAEPSAVPDRSRCYQEAKAKFAARRPVRCTPSADTEVPAVSYVIPFRDIGRSDAIATVVNNVRAQRFPVVDIVLAEQDDVTRINLASLGPATHLLVGGEPLFNKSLAFNRGVAAAAHGLVVLHDADTMAPGWYTQRVYLALLDYESCHLGSKVIYADQISTAVVCASGQVDHNVQCDRVVGYYEGGSLACRVDAYWAVGGFNEDFKGYGCEDCDFYYRLRFGSKFLDHRTVDLLHLWHGRVPGWEEAHARNKTLEQHLRGLDPARYISEQVAKTAHYRGARR